MRSLLVCLAPAVRVAFCVSLLAVSSSIASHAAEPPAGEGIAAAAPPYAPPNLWMEALTWPEIAMALRSGYRTILVPTAGIEQNGPHIPLYKHRRVVRVTAEKIAADLGNTLVAPVIDFVPEGDIATREGHMAYPGTISMPPRLFSSILENTARSMISHGFVNVIFIGDSGPNQEWQARVAKTMRGEGLNVFHIDEYYANEAQEAYLRQRGYTDAQIGGHAGLRDTSEFMAAARSETRMDRLENIPESRFTEMGSYGDLTLADATLGIQLLQIKVERTILEVCRLSLDLPGCQSKR